MSGIPLADAEDLPAAAPTYACMFGIYNQEAPWTDVRKMPWTELAVLLTGIPPTSQCCGAPDW